MTPTITTMKKEKKKNIVIIMFIQLILFLNWPTQVVPVGTY